MSRCDAAGHSGVFRVQAHRAVMQRLVAFYVRDHNERMPHYAFNGQTPDEMYFGEAPFLVQELKTQGATALVARLVRNGKMACRECPKGPIKAENQALRLIGEPVGKQRGAVAQRQVSGMV